MTGKGPAWLYCLIMRKYLYRFAVNYPALMDGASPVPP
ncbi:hypothetical protein [Archaeoglobus fulgidus]